MALTRDDVLKHLEAIAKHDGINLDAEEVWNLYAQGDLHADPQSILDRAIDQRMGMEGGDLVILGPRTASERSELATQLGFSSGSHKALVPTKSEEEHFQALIRAGGRMLQDGEPTIEDVTSLFRMTTIVRAEDLGDLHRMPAARTLPTAKTQHHALQVDYTVARPRIGHEGGKPRLTLIIVGTHGTVRGSVEADEGSENSIRRIVQQYLARPAIHNKPIDDYLHQIAKRSSLRHNRIKSAYGTTDPDAWTSRQQRLISELQYLSEKLHHKLHIDRDEREKQVLALNRINYLVMEATRPRWPKTPREYQDIVHRVRQGTNIAAMHRANDEFIKDVWDGIIARELRTQVKKRGEPTAPPNDESYYFRWPTDDPTVRSLVLFSKELLSRYWTLIAASPVEHFVSSASKAAETLDKLRGR